jgi:hypothetical protein
LSGSQERPTTCVVLPGGGERVVLGALLVCRLGEQGRHGGLLLLLAVALAVAHARVAALGVGYVAEGLLLAHLQERGTGLG